MQNKKSMKTDNHNQEADEDSERNIVSVGKTKFKQPRKINGLNVRATKMVARILLSVQTQMHRLR
jgi:hypothetical protein